MSRRLSRRLAPLATTLVIGGSLALTGCGAGSALVGVSDAPAEVTTTAPLAADAAQRVAVRVLDGAAAAQAATGAQAAALRAASLTGGALTVANADSRIGAPGSGPSAAVTRREAPRVLALSQGRTFPRLMLVQGGGQSAPVLHLLISPEPTAPFKLAASAPMEPGAEIAALPDLANGAPVVTTGSALAVAPATLMGEYAASLAFPKPVPATHVDPQDRFARGVRASAAAQAASFGALATLTQRHTVLPGQTIAIGLKDGGAVVFGLLQRQDLITLKPGGKSLTPSAQFQKLVGKKTLSKSAELTTYETVVFTVPAQGRATLVAVDEQLVTARGQ